MKSSVTRQLYIGFSFAILLVLLVGFASYQTFQKQTSQAGWVRHTYEVIGNLENLQKLLVDMETGRRGYRSTAEEVFLEPYNNAVRQVPMSMRLLGELVSDNFAQVTNVERLQSSVNNLMSFWSRQGYNVAQLDRPALVAMATEEKKQMDVIRTQIVQMVHQEKQLLTKRENENQASVRLAVLELLVGTFLILLVVLALIFLILRELNTRRRAERAVKKNMEELAALNMQSEERNWLLSGVTKVNEHMQGNTDSYSMCRSILSSLLDYLELPAGALYLYAEEQEVLELKASLGIGSEAVARYTLGTGLIGRAATLRELVVLNDVPGSYWRLESGVGASTPGSIVLVPLWLGKELKGVLEIGGFVAFTNRLLQFLKVISNNLSINIGAVQATEKVMHLLETVQEQKETLVNQQEELRQANEELMRQTEVLQSSEEELRVQEEELRQINAELEERNEAVEIARQALVQKALELEVTSKYKSEFLANMSHELRTPLNSVLILAKLLSENKNSNLTPKQTEYANIIHKSGSDLLNLINDILDLSKIEAGKVEFHYEQVPVKTIFHDMQQLFMVMAEEKGVHFILETGEGMPEQIYADKQRLEQVVKNLLSNAFKFTPKNGRITFRTHLHSGETGFTEARLVKSEQVIVFSVTDTGIGISKEKQQLIFEAFQQADGSTSRKFGGTGLGLSISKELVRKMGGEIRVESEEGKGSTFLFYLPHTTAAIDTPVTVTPAALPEAEAPAPVDTSRVVQQTRLEDDRNNLHPNDKVMLIIEDDPGFASIIQEFSRNKKFKTIVALKGDEGLYYARKYRPSAIMLDMQLPVIDGWSLLRIIKSDDALKHIPVHIISGADESRLRSSGAMDYLKKPVAKEDLEKAFDRIGAYLSAKVKKVLVLSGDYIKDDNLHKLIRERHIDADCIYASNVKEAQQLAEQTRFDCIIADIGSNINNGIEELKQLHAQGETADIPVIIYLDKDISQADELQLKKVSDVIIRESSFSKDRLIDEMELFLYKVQQVEKAPAARQQAAALSDNNLLKGKKILLVDDDMRNVFALSTALEEQEMEVVTASDGKEALEYLRVNKGIHLVLMDVMMPGMDGYEATRLIRHELKLNKLPIIALTAKAMSGDREKCIEAGASDYITKPVDTARLFSLMHVWLSQ